MLSGGEPAVREDLPQIIERLSELNITRILLNTNGRRIARDDRFVDFLRRFNNRIEVYLQWDGQDKSTFITLRGEDVLEEKKTALARLESAGVFTTLVATVQSGVNDHELGALVRLGLQTPHCAGIMLQPMFGSGRFPVFDPQKRVTPTGVLRRLGEQTNGLLSADDFIPLPCSHRDCCDITYLLQLDDGTWESLPQLIGREELKKWIHLVANTISFDNVGQAARSMLQTGVLQRVFSEQQKISTPALLGDIMRMCECVPQVPAVLGSLWNAVKKSPTSNEQSLRQAAQRTFRITVKMFMDAHTFHEARIRQCCVHTGTYEEDPRRYSFCWRWLFADAGDFK
jgi:uncharacterized radical SAM superfamily Fe-S cluster-containing enzyme